MQTPLPEFENPPLDEVVIGVQFEPLQQLHAAHQGLYWSRIRDRYPLTEDQPPLLPIMELPTIGPAQPQVLLQMGGAPRCWFQDETKNHLIQLQADRFLRNWRQVQGTEPYPRYAKLIQEFKLEWELFCTFVQETGLGHATVNQCELTYINNILVPKPEELGKVATVFTWAAPPDPTGFLPLPETINWGARYQLPEGRGRLHVTMNPAFRGRDVKLIQALNLTARGAPSGKSAEEIFAWFDMAHEWIVRAFEELTHPSLHYLWKKKR